MQMSTLDSYQYSNNTTVLCMWAWERCRHGRRKGGAGGDLAPLDFEIISKKMLFFQFRGVKTKFHHFCPPLETIFGISPTGLPGKNPSDAHGCRPSAWKWLQKIMKKKNRVHTWCSIFHWQKARNNARPPDTAKLRWKSILSVLDPTFCCLPSVSCCLPSAYGIEQGFSNYGSWPQVGSQNVILWLRNQLAWQIRYNNFCKIYKKIESRPAVNLFLLHFYF